MRSNAMPEISFSRTCANPMISRRVIATALVVSLPCIKAGANSGDDLVKKGDAYEAKFDERNALGAYLAAEKLAPPNAELLRRIAQEYGELMADTNSTDEKRSLGEKAIAYAQRSVAADSHDAMAQLAVAVCYGRVAPLMDNKTKIAYSRFVKEYADKALALDPDNDLTYNVLGSWNYALASLNPVLRSIAGWIYGQLPDASYEESVKDFQHALQLNPNRLANHIGLGRAYAALGKTVEARTEIERGLSMPDRAKDDPYVKQQDRETLRGI
jgi:tetratricopeptide (TPR) repeat protein